LIGGGMTQNVEKPRLIVFKRLLRLLILACLTLYVVALIIVASNQRWFIYPAPKLTLEQVNEMARSGNLERWTNSSGQFIGLKRQSPWQQASGSILIAYGNGDAAGNYGGYADSIQSVAPLNVFVLEYPGYADRPGKPSQDSLFRAADEAFQLLPTNMPIYLVGQSLGTGVAVYLAGLHSDKVAGVVLVSPYNRLVDVAQYQMPLFPVHLLLIDRFPSEDYLRNYHGPVGMVVDGRDEVVPEKFGLRLYNGYTGPKKLWEFPNAGHASIAGSQQKFWKEAIEFWQTNSSH
jgi:pimeloyl-ACP methyl ester carboxylesterase